MSGELTYHLELAQRSYEKGITLADTESLYYSAEK